MEINKDYLMAQKATLEKQLEQLMATANAAKGALSIIQSHLLYLEKEAQDAVQQLTNKL